MSTTYTNGTMKASRLSELEQVIFRLANKPQLTYPAWENVSQMSYRDIIAYMEKAEPHYQRLLVELDPTDPIEAWALHMIRSEPLPPIKCAALANEFEALLSTVAEHDQSTVFGSPELYFLSLQALLIDHIKALKECASNEAFFKYNS